MLLPACAGVLQSIYTLLIISVQVQVMAAFSIRALLSDEQNQEDLKPLLPQLLQAYLKLI